MAGCRERSTYEDLVPILRGLVERHGWDPKMQGDQIFGASVRVGILMAYVWSVTRCTCGSAMLRRDQSGHFCCSGPSSP